VFVLDVGRAALARQGTCRAPAAPHDAAVAAGGMLAANVDVIARARAL